jgi:predicted transposase/invertase (TIGR01784 family)
VFRNIKIAAWKTVDYCLKHDILKDVLEKHATEVVNMLKSEWKMKDALAAWYEDGMEDGMEKGREEGMEKGREQIARNALLKGLSIDVIHEITGLDAEMIKRLQDQERN